MKYEARYSGIGFVIKPPYVLVDLDGCRDPETGVVGGWARQIVLDLNSWTEISPSGRGLHIWLKGKLPQGRRRAGRVEVYDGDRYGTITGNRWPGVSAEIEARDLTLFHARLEELDPECGKQLESTAAAQRSSGASPAGSNTAPTPLQAVIRTQDPATSAELARKRQTDPLALTKQLRSDLDSIALKALEKDRGAVTAHPPILPPTSGAT